MNHDCCHCLDYDEAECPETCFRARLTKEYNECCVDFEEIPVTWAHLKDTQYCAFSQPKCTRFDIFRTMSVEDLAEFLCESRFTCGNCPAAEFCKDGHIGFIDWLKQEAESEGKE